MKQLLKEYSGIVLKQYDHSQYKFGLLDSKLGVIEGIFLSTRVMSGALLRYDLKENNGRYFINNFEVLDVPLSLAKLDLLFVHHVLELCFYFMPTGSGNHTIFELLMLLYKSSQVVWSVQAKKIFLFKLLTTIGLYDEHPIFKKPFIIQLLHTSIDNIHTQSIDLECEKDIMNWLSICVFDHPDIKYFKTTAFLSEHRTP